MRKYKYTGVFHYQGYEGETLSFTLEVSCNGFLQAFILLTAKALNEGKCYQLDHIQNEEGSVRKIVDLFSLKFYD